MSSKYHFFEHLLEIIDQKQDLLYVDSLLYHNFSLDGIKEFEKNIFFEDSVLLKAISRARIRDIKKEKCKIYIVVAKDSFFRKENIEALSTLKEYKTDCVIFFVERGDFVKRNLFSKHYLKGQWKKVENAEYDTSSILLNYLQIPYLGPFLESEEYVYQAYQMHGCLIVHVLVSDLDFVKNMGEKKIETILKQVMKSDNKVQVLDCLYNFSMHKNYKNLFLKFTYALTEAEMLSSSGLKPIVVTSSKYLNDGLNSLYEIGKKQVPMVVICEIDENDRAMCFNLPMVILETKCLEELEYFIRYAFFISKPVLIRYTKKINYLTPLKEVRMNRWEILEEGNDVVIMALGSMMEEAYYLKEELEKKHCFPAIVQMTSVWPVDDKLVMHLGKSNLKMIVFDHNHVMDYFIKEIHQLGYKDPVIMLSDDKKIKVEEILKMIGK